MITIYTPEIKDVVRQFIKKQVMGAKVPVPFFHGKPGVSKSAQIAQVAKEFNFKLRDVRLAQMSAMDIRGLPVINKDDKVTEWYTPNFLPTQETIAQMKSEGFKGMVLFFDELSSTMPAVQAAAYQIILDRASGDYVMPNDPEFPIIMLAAGNNLKDGAVVNNMSTALKNRMAHYQVEVDADGFIKYGLNNNMDHRVISFIKNFPQHLHVMPAKGDPSIYAFPTNRSWEFVSELIKGDTYSDLLHKMIAGVVGEAMASEFATHMELADKLPDLDELLDRGVPLKLDMKNISLVWAFTIAVCAKMIGKRDKVTDSQITNFLQAIEQLKPEFMYLALDQILHMEDKKLIAQRYAPNKAWHKAIQSKLRVITGL